MAEPVSQTLFLAQVCWLLVVVAVAHEHQAQEQLHTVAETAVLMQMALMALQIQGAAEAALVATTVQA